MPPNHYLYLEKYNLLEEVNISYSDDKSKNLSQPCKSAVNIYPGDHMTEDALEIPDPLSS